MDRVFTYVCHFVTAEGDKLRGQDCVGGPCPGPCLADSGGAGLAWRRRPGLASRLCPRFRSAERLPGPWRNSLVVRCPRRRIAAHYAGDTGGHAGASGLSPLHVAPGILVPGSLVLEPSAARRDRLPDTNRVFTTYGDAF